MSTALRRGRLLAAAALTAATVAVGSAPAQAVAHWTTIDDMGSKVSVLLCQKQVNGPYGPLWEINAAVLTAPDYGGSITVNITRGGSVVGSIKVQAENGQWKTGQIHASRLQGDRVGGKAGVGQLSTGAAHGGIYGPFSPSTLATCA